MIQRLASTSPAFKGNNVASPRDSYESLMSKNIQTAQKQNKIVATSNQNQIPMQGSGQKLDVIV